jgi:hypothetical protein
MSRFDTLEQKVEKLIDRSFIGVRTNIENGAQVNQETFQRRLEELVAFMQYFRDKKLYIIDLPVCNVLHPDGARRLVDPNLRNVPSNITLNVESYSFNDSYELVETFSQLLGEEKEIFLYSLEYVTIYNPTNFEPTYRIVARYASVDFGYWYTPIEEHVNGNNLYIPNNDFNFELGDENLSKNEITLKIVNNILRHKF